MPSNYAHYRFGFELIRRLPPELQTVICRHADLYAIGLHGPDILFYYHPICPNQTKQIGYGLHGVPAVTFFTQARTTIGKLSCADEAMVYILGFICHFALDSLCHPYIEAQIKATGITHTEIEVEFDSALLRRDGYDPLTHSTVEHIKPTKRNAAVIANFFPTSAEKIQYALRSMVRYNRFLIAPHKPKRAAIRTALFLSGHYRDMHGLLVRRAPNPACVPINARLEVLYGQALDLAETLICEFASKSKAPLNPAYQRTFGAE